jgi:hypothetical protein
MISQMDEDLKSIINAQILKGTTRWRKEPNGSYLIFSKIFYNHFNESAGFIYSKLDGLNTIKDVLAYLYVEYPSTDKNCLYRDLIHQIRVMQKIGLVTIISII